MSDQSPVPIPFSYWVRPGRLLAGEHPGAGRDNRARQRLRDLLDAGVTTFLDLTEEGEFRLNPYAHLLEVEVQARGGTAEHHRAPIRDGEAPTPAEMARILDLIDGALEAGGIVYVHCDAGVGRTGTVIGCYLVRHGTAGDDALDEIARLRVDTPDRWAVSPGTPDQRAMVREWGG